MLTFVSPSIDVSLPTECDDEYWIMSEGQVKFQQPPNKPSKISAFNCYIRLNQILASATRTIVRNMYEHLRGTTDRLCISIPSRSPAHILVWLTHIGNNGLCQN